MIANWTCWPSLELKIFRFVSVALPHYLILASLSYYENIMLFCHIPVTQEKKGFRKISAGNLKLVPMFRDSNGFKGASTLVTLCLHLVSFNILLQWEIQKKKFLQLLMAIKGSKVLLHLAGITKHLLSTMCKNAYAKAWSQGGAALHSDISVLPASTLTTALTKAGICEVLNHSSSFHRTADVYI